MSRAGGLVGGNPTGAIGSLAAGVFPTFGRLGRLEVIENFTRVDDGLSGVAAVVSGTVASVVDFTTAAGRAGVAQLTTGTDTTGRAAVISGVSAFQYSAAARYRLRGDIRLTGVSDGTDTFVARLGFLDSPSAEPTDGVYFRYTHSVNSGKWECVTRVAGVETATDSGVAAVGSSSFTVFEIQITASSSAAFYIDGVLVQTNVTNIPSGANRSGYGLTIIKSAGTNARTVDIDLLAWSLEPTTPI